VRPDWQRLAEQGLLVLLFDGLDEVPAGTRPIQLSRISTFSARYPASPWILTVRDPSVLSGLAEAQLVELLPLSDSDIVRFIEAMKVRLPDVAPWSFARRLERYPDLRRLARIPLFLAMLLATVDTEGDIPRTRSDLIEAYVKTLFAPQEHKSVEGQHDKVVQLRAIAEALAFERLERQEIGASEREVRDVIQRVADNGTNSEQLLSTLLANGVLRHQSAIRLQFPFPIVQEYLAAHYLVRHAPSTLASRIDDAIQRPWAQVIQFALELHAEPEPIIRAMLDRSDDAFCTGLRLVGRCIANGAHVSPSLRADVGNKLVKFWISAPTRARERVGQVIANGFASPLTPSLREALHCRWLFDDGAGEILSALKNEALTMSVLHSMLAPKLERFSLYHPLKPAFQSIGDRAFNAIIDFATASELTEDQWAGVASMLSHFAPGTVDRSRALAVADNADFPLEVRLTAYKIAGAPLEGRAFEVIELALQNEEFRRGWRVSRIVALHADRSEFLAKPRRNSALPIENRTDLAGGMLHIFPEATDRAAFLELCRSDNQIPSKVVDVGLLVSARFGDRAAFVDLIKRLPQLPLDLAQQAIMLFGHHPVQELAERAAELVEGRELDAEAMVRMGSAAVTGMLYIFEMGFGFSGALRETAPHAGTARWMTLVEQWADRSNLTILQRLGLLESASRLGSDRAALRLQQEVLAIGDPDDPRYEDGDDYGHRLRNAVSEARRKMPLLPLSLAERLTRSKRPNIPYSGIGAIEAHGTREALDLLLRLHHESRNWHHREWHHSDTIENAVESLAAKLGVTIREVDDVLAV
jgi:hypothetical protein